MLPLLCRRHMLLCLPLSPPPANQRCAVALWLQTSREVAGSIPPIEFAQFRLELTKLSLLVPCKPAHPRSSACACMSLGLGCPSARASVYGSVIDHRSDVKLGF